MADDEGVELGHPPLQVNTSYLPHIALTIGGLAFKKQLRGLRAVCSILAP